MARTGRSIILKIKDGENKTTSASIDETIADLFCLRKANILCDGEGVTLLREFCESKIKMYHQKRQGISAFLRKQLLFALINDEELVKKYIDKDYDRVFRK